MITNKKVEKNKVTIKPGLPKKLFDANTFRKANKKRHHDLQFRKGMVSCNDKEKRKKAFEHLKEEFPAGTYRLWVFYGVPIGVMKPENPLRFWA